MKTWPFWKGCFKWLPTIRNQKVTNWITWKWFTSSSFFFFKHLNFLRGGCPIEWGLLGNPKDSVWGRLGNLAGKIRENHHQPGTLDRINPAILGMVKTWPFWPGEWKRDPFGKVGCKRDLETFGVLQSGHVELNHLVFQAFLELWFFSFRWDPGPKWPWTWLINRGYYPPWN